MVGERPGTLFQVPSCSDWQWAKQELMNNPLLLDWEKPCTDDTIWSLKPCRKFIWDVSQAERWDLQARQEPLGSALSGDRLSDI